MSSADIESLIPFLQQLLQRMRFQPPAADLVLLQKATFKEMRPYFDALAAGTPEQEVYKMIISYLATGKPATPAPVAAPTTAVKQQTSPQRAVSPPKAAAAPQNTGKQVRKLMDDVELHITQQVHGPNKLPAYAFELATKGTPNPVTLTVDFSDSSNVELHAEGPSKATGPLSISVNVPTIVNTGGELLVASIATVQAQSGNHSLSYKVGLKGTAAQSSAQPAAKPVAAPNAQNNAAAPAPEEGDDVTTIADGLSVLVRSVDSGYLLFANNSNANLKYFVQVNLAESSNLTFVASGTAKLVEEAKITVSLPPAAGIVEIAKCNVKDFSLGSCDIRYKVSARIE